LHSGLQHKHLELAPSILTCRLQKTFQQTEAEQLEINSNILPFKGKYNISKQQCDKARANDKALPCLISMVITTLLLVSYGHDQNQKQ
jgi:hypothetical protein